MMDQQNDQDNNLKSYI